MRIVINFVRVRHVCVCFLLSLGLLEYFGTGAFGNKKKQRQKQRRRGQRSNKDRLSSGSSHPASVSFDRGCSLPTLLFEVALEVHKGFRPESLMGEHECVLVSQSSASDGNLSAACPCKTLRHDAKMFGVVSVCCYAVAMVLELWFAQYETGHGFVHMSDLENVRW